MKRLLVFGMGFALLSAVQMAQAATDAYTASGTWTAPAGVTSVDVEVWGGGGAGGGNPTNQDGAGGGGGGAYSKTTAITVVPGTVYTVTVGAGGIGGAGVGGNGGDSWFSTVGTILAKGGTGGADPVAGAGGVAGTGGAAAAGIGALKFSGGNGGTGRNSNTGRGGPGGSSAGTAAAGTSGPVVWATATAAAAPAGGGIGGNGGNANGQSGFAPASGNGGGGGGGAEQSTLGGNGAPGKVAITYTPPPSVMSINTAGANPTNAASISWTVVFNTSVTGVSSSNFEPINSGLGGTPAITGVSGSGTTWTVTASTGTGSGTLGLNMISTTGITPALVGLPFTTGQVYTIDRTAPTVSSIALVDPSPTALASVSWTVTFGETVTGVDTTDFALAQAGGVSGALITGVTPVSGTVYTVTASTGTGSGTLGLDLADNDSIVDTVSNPLGGAGAGNGDFSGAVYYVIRPVTASPTACVNVAGIGTQPWSTLTGPLASDNAYATASVTDNQTTNYLQCTGYGFAIPAGATINGITVNVERKASSTLVRDAAMRLVKGGVIDPNLANDRSTATNYTTADVIEAHGGVADLWGTTWTAADINAASFGAALASIKAGTAGGARTVSVDHMSITVDYTLPVNCTSNASGNWTLPATWTDCRGGIPLANDGVTILGAHTVTLNTTTPVLGNLTNGGTLNASGANTLNIGGNFTNTGTTSLGSTTVNLYGDFTNNNGANFNLGGAGTGTWNFLGTAQQNINSTGILTTFPSLTLNNALGIALNASATVKTLLTLTNGNVTTGANILGTSANCPASIARASGFVDGNLRLTFPAGTTTCTYHVGSGATYAPIGITMVASSGGTLTGSTTGNEHPLIAGSGIDANMDVNRYWSLWSSGDTVVATSYGPTFNFVAGDVDATATPANFVVGKHASGAWTLPTPVTAGATSTGVSNVAGPISGATDFVAGEVVFVCTVPAGSPVGTTCVCDNFGRAALNPSTIYGGNWSVSSSDATGILPSIVNSGYLRLTNNTGNNAKAATVPGNFPAVGNWVSVEFKHYAYSGTGADGIALTLSDSAITPTPGAFGGSLGYAQKSNPGSDCTTPGGCPGFNGGWVGIGIDEYGNFSNPTEGRIGGPGRILDSVSVRGSGSGQIGYPYLAGSATLAPGIDNAASPTAAYGHAYRLTVDARGYTWNGTSGTRSTLVQVERDTTGTGASYTPVVPSFDAYVANPSQADVPVNWKMSFTGSTGGATNIHEISGLKICAQTYVPPAGYSILVDNLTPTTCPTDPRPTVTVKPLNANGQVVTTYTNTVTLSATLLGGGAPAGTVTWTKLSGGGAFTPAGASATYTYVAGDVGVASFSLHTDTQQNLYINVTETPGTLSTTLGTPVQFSSGAASFVVNSAADTLGTGVVAGRPHLMSITRNASVCGGGTDATYTGSKMLDGWYAPAGADHPVGALAPQICATSGGTCLPTTGACQTLSIAAPSIDPNSNNMPALTFTAGVASFCLVTSDVGKYSINLRDDSVATGTPDVTGSTSNLTVRPFAVVVSDVKQGATNNPANNTSGGSVFAKAGTAFQATVAGYLWNSAGDTGSNGLPGAAANWSAITAAGIAPSYADSVTPAAAAPFTPAGVAQQFGSVAVTGGSGTTTALSYDEVGSFTLTATPATTYLNTAGVNLANRVAVFSKPADTTYRGGVVGRFIPDHFDTSVVLSTGVPMPCLNGIDPATSLPWACPASNDLQNGFVYSGQPFSVQVIAKNLAGVPTANYDGTLGYAKPVTLEAWDAKGGTTTQNPSGSLANSSPITATFGAGVATATTPIYSLGAALTAPTDIYMRAKDTDNVTSLRAIPSNSVEGGVKVVSGRVKIGNAHGSELLALPMSAVVQYYNGTNWLTSLTDSVTSLTLELSNYQCKTAGCAWTTTAIPASGQIIAGSLPFKLSKPTGVGTGSVDIATSAPAYLPGTTGRATFGVYKGSNEFIYLRESY